MLEVSFKPIEYNLTNFNEIYFDSINGNDLNDGSIKAPFKSLEKLNDVISKVSIDTLILIKKNSKYEGTLKIDFTLFEKNSVLYISSYGDGNKPIIDGIGNDHAVIVNRSNLVIDGLEITNKLGLTGIFVDRTKGGTLENLTVKNCHVYDVNWNEDGHDLNILNIDPYKICPEERYYRETGGIIFVAEGEDPTNFKNIFVSFNNIHHVSRTGIIFTGIHTRRPGTPWGINKYVNDDLGWYPHERIVIDHNDVDYCGGDSIVLIGATDSFIEYNKAYHCNFLGRTNNANAGIWPIGVKRIVIQYNEAAYGHLEHGGLDGEGFDLDIACTDCLFQYNYAHDNDGGALLICNCNSNLPLFDENQNPVMDENSKQVVKHYEVYWGNNIVRNNLSVNNGKENVNPEFLHYSANCKDLLVENNTVIISNKFDDQYIIRCADYADSGHQDNITYRKNIFYSKNENNATFYNECVDRYYFYDNVYKNLTDKTLSTTNEVNRVMDDVSFDLPESLDGFDKFYEILKSNKTKTDCGVKIK